MPQGLTTASLRWAAGRLADAMKLHAPELNELDGAVGDGDLGVTLARAADRLSGELSGLPDDVGLALLQCAQAFTKVSGSTYGTLLATGLMAAARLAQGRTLVPWGETAALAGAALEAMSRRGKGRLGDKTVLDAVEAIRQAADGLDDPAAIAAAAAAAIAAARERLRGQVFRQGRARIFGARGIGLDDPGMVALQRIVESLVEVAG